MNSSPAAGVRVVAALCAQPFVAAALAFASFPLVERTGRPLYRGIPVDALDAAGSFAAGVAIVAFFVTLFGALPAVLWLTWRCSPFSITKVLLSGLALGNVPVVLLSLVAGSYGPYGTIRAVAIGSFLGVSSAFVFWLIAGDGSGRSDAPSGRVS